MRVIAAPQAKGIEALSTRPHQALVHAVEPGSARHFDASLPAATAFLSPLKDLAASSLSALLPVTTPRGHPAKVPGERRSYRHRRSLQGGAMRREERGR